MISVQPIGELNRNQIPNPQFTTESTLQFVNRGFFFKKLF
uniref:Uncharacterized protein n=1 Tax=Anguilla anguilla TaxID=7936 RepID=A0A0E9T2M3_ANGAN